MKDFLKKLIESKKNRITQIRSAVQASSDVNEVRSLTAEAEGLQAELREAEQKLADLEAEEARAAQNPVPANAQHVNGGVVAAAYNMPAADNRDANPLESAEYRSAFMAYVQKGTQIPAELRAGQTISTNETGAAIPLTIMNEVINTIRKRLSDVKGGRFAQKCAPAKVFSIVLSDILGDPLDMIASGPAYPDSTTCEQAIAIAKKV